MRHLKRLLLPLLLLLLGGVPALAQNGGWTVSEVKGGVTVIDSSGERAAVVGVQLAPGTTIRTATRASAVLVRGREFVTMRQNAQLRIAPAEQTRGIVQILQDYGSALFNIGKQPNPHFGVDTPYLAAVVKGTTFVITVSGAGASLQVTEGAVETATLDGGARELIRPGSVAMIAAADPLRMVIEGDSKRVVDSPARGTRGAAPAAPAVPTSPGAAAGIEPAAHDGGGPARIEEAIVSTPRQLGEVSGGFVSGEVAALVAVVVSDNTARGNAPPVGSNRGRAEDGEVCLAGTCSGSGGDGSAGGSNGNGNNGNGGGNGGNSGDAPGNGNGNNGNGGGNGGNAGEAPGNGNGNNGNGGGNGGNDRGDRNNGGRGGGEGRPRLGTAPLSDLALTASVVPADLQR